ncbi:MULTISPECIES: M10 family metallopeptidase [unclassified Rhizobium]|uniref:M10 family metallopeptidase n=1 Tax=unclassified Rhizobium TaxID=2613769 RepID=UPI000712DBE2|nr:MULTISPECIES: M10 family metallopeptidase [unclassified Rhizobium]KQS88361.1 protease [Rhizobium sp. Leaf391]KQT03952.1 protease [Rhizobium sp. Leaf386]KQT95586.1 protease [Rhizobium sp. Leaf453]
MTGINKSVNYISETGSPLIDGVLSGYAWGSTVSYAFPTSTSSYSYGDEKYYGFTAISAEQQNAALFTMEQSFGNAANDSFSVEGFTDLDFEKGGASTSTLRFAQSNLPDTAYAFYPGQDEWSGDTWFGTKYEYREPVAGNYAWFTTVHEIGHALGLKHGHETTGFGALPAEYDSLEFSIMTYRSHVGADIDGLTTEDFGNPQTFMMADIAALQEMYGADFTANSSNTVYKWTPQNGKTIIDGGVAISPGANRIFATIWDGDGTDTFDLTAYNTALKIDLRPGQASLFSEDQLAYLGGGPNDGFARGNIFNSLLYNGDTRSLIENVKGGSGNDQIIGNDVTNTLRGNSGNDTLRGVAGNDVLIGGAGADFLSGGSGSDTASYAEAGRGVYAHLYNSSVNTNEATGDTFSSIENLKGSRYADKLIGNTGANILSGDSGNDTLTGMSDADKLYGGAGADQLTGGSDADTFQFKALSDSTVALSGRDTIFDFGGSQGDKIDLSGIDANIGVSGNQAFNYIGTTAFSGKAAELRYVKGASETTIYGDVNGDKKIDFAIYLDDAVSLQKGYFIL